jgi:general secretion pathway protein D
MNSARWKNLKVITAATAFTLLGGCGATRLHYDGMKDVDHGHYESGVSNLRKALDKQPDNFEYRRDLRSRTEAAIQTIAAEADAARKAGHAEAAVAAYRRILAIDPADDRGLRGLEGIDGDSRHAEAVSSARAAVENKDLDRADSMLRAVLAEDPDYADAVALSRTIERIRGPVQSTPRLQTKENRPVTLQFRDASTKMVFEVLSKQTGLNFIFDKDVKADGKTTIFVHDVPVETAIDLVLAQNQLARDVLAPNMVLIYPNTAAKQKDYQDEVVKTFYLNDADPKQVQTLLKTIVNPKALFVDERTGTIVVRDIPEVMRMAEKLVASVDLPDSEVLLEVEVLELAHSNVQNLGIQYPTSASFAMNPVGATGKTLSVSDLAQQGKSTVSVSSIGATLNLLKTNGVTNTLASPRIRVKNHEKAKVLIGQRVPVITNSVTPTTSQAVVTGSVQYLEVGLTLEAEPTVHRDGDVALKLGLEVSSILNQVTNPASGSVAYQIGTRNANTVLQLRDGETQILAGLIQDTDQKAANKIPGLGDFPLLGRLFSSHKTDREKTEIVLAVTPRIVRAQRSPPSETTEFWYGNESGTRNAPLGGVTIEGLGSAGGARSSAPIPAAVNAPIASTAAPMVGVPQGANADASAAASPAGTVSWEVPNDVKVGDEFDAALNLDTGEGASQIRAQIRYDVNVLELVSSSSGSVLGSAEAKIDSPRGMVLLEAKASNGTITGSGQLVSMHFRALAARPMTSISGRVAVVNGAGVSVNPTTPPAASLMVKP